MGNDVVTAIEPPIIELPGDQVSILNGQDEEITIYLPAAPGYLEYVRVIPAQDLAPFTVEIYTTSEIDDVRNLIYRNVVSAAPLYDNLLKSLNIGAYQVEVSATGTVTVTVDDAGLALRVKITNNSGFTEVYYTKLGYRIMARSLDFQPSVASGLNSTPDAHPTIIENPNTEGLQTNGPRGVTSMGL